MHFVGVDLAWGDRRPTGLAVLDDEGHLLHVSAAATDDEIVAALAPYVEDDCLVAIDAPLIVTNATGNRPAEAALNKDFARFDAGAHPSNTGKPEFRDQPRGARIAARLGLDMNPRVRTRPPGGRGLPSSGDGGPVPAGADAEVQEQARPRPRAAPLRADRPAGSARGSRQRRPPLLVSGHAADRRAARTWQVLRSAVEKAGRKSEPRVVEDQVDAVICAYVALFATRQQKRTTTYGDFETGYIVTPTLPDDLVPTPRGPRIAPEIRDPGGSAVREYAEMQPDLRRAADQFVQLVTSILDEAGINYLSVTGRAKSVASFAAKAARTVDGRPSFTDPLREITDQIGVRVITYVHSDVQAVADLLDDQVVVHDDRDMGRETASEGRFGYASRHLLVGLDAARENQPAYELLRGRQAQVQIRTVLQHAGRSSSTTSATRAPSPTSTSPTSTAGSRSRPGCSRLADREFSTIRDRLGPG